MPIVQKAGGFIKESYLEKQSYSLEIDLKLQHL
jgi:hypothetical protein